MYVSMYVCMYVCMCACMYVWMYMYVYIVCNSLGTYRLLISLSGARALSLFACTRRACLHRYFRAELYY